MILFRNAVLLYSYNFKAISFISSLIIYDSAIGPRSCKTPKYTEHSHVYGFVCFANYYISGASLLQKFNYKITFFAPVAERRYIEVFFCFWTSHYLGSTN